MSYFVMAPAELLRKDSECKYIQSEQASVVQSRNISSDFYEQIFFQIRSSSFCTVMVLTNLASPKWIPGNCNTKLGKVVYCLLEKRNINYDNLTFDIPELLCPKGTILTKESCYLFLWGNLKIAKDQRHNLPFVLFDAVRETFPPIFSVNLTHIITYTRCCETYRFEFSPVVHNYTEALYRKTEKLQNIIAGGNIFRCFKNIYILMIFVCDGNNDCPGVASDEIGCECNRSSNYSSKCKFTIDKSGKRSCSIFYLRTVANNCHIFSFAKDTEFDDGKQAVQNKTLQCNGLMYQFSRTNDVVIKCRNKEENTTKFKDTGICTQNGKMYCDGENSICYNISDICVYKLNFFGYLIPCRTGGHIQNCKEVQCNIMFKCPNYHCIPLGYLCDGKWDCPGGVDEFSTKCGENRSCVNLFKCRGYQICVHFGDVCNSYNDCPFGDDEYFCTLHSKLCPIYCECLLFFAKCINANVVRDVYLNYQIILIQYFHFNISTFRFVFKYIFILTITDTNLDSICHAASEINSLVSLDISSNAVIEINSRCFQNAFKLKIIKINDNLISTIQENAFYNISTLLLLNISGNLLPVLRHAMFNDLVKIDIFSMKGINMSRVDTDAFEEIHFKILETQNYFLCCLVPLETKCSSNMPWYATCADLLPHTAVKITFYTICFVILIGNIASIILQRMSFLQKLDKTGAYGITVASINVADIIGAIPLFVLWIADLSFKNIFFLNENYWRSSVFCYFTFGTNICFNIMSPSFLYFLAFSRLMVVLYPMDTEFKDTKFVFRWLLTILAASNFVAITFTITSWYLTLNIPMSLCSPFIDLTNDITIIKVITFLTAIMQVTAAICILIVYSILIVSLKKSQETLQQSMSKKQSNLSLVVQIIIVTSSNILSWIPCGIIYVMVMFMEKYPIDMLIWITIGVAPINSVVNPIVFISTTVRKILKS